MSSFLQPSDLPPSTGNTVPIATDEIRQQVAQQIRDGLRPGQQQMADWQGGALAVSAVPGSGKSTGMAAAAALAIARYRLNLKRQLVAVTFTRSAAASLKDKIRGHLRNLKLPAGGFAVYTLHGLALHIATRHPEFSGINLETQTLITPTQGHRLIRTCVEQWIVDYPRPFQQLLEGRQFDREETERLRRQSVLRTEVLPGLAQTAVREAKSSGMVPDRLRQLAAQDASAYDWLTVAAGLYDRYQANLQRMEAIDYDDMILAALRVLAEPGLRRLWQERVFAVFEDEAQDSSPLQFRLLEALAADPTDPDASPNIVRVGDPNQAINSTFTPADPVYFRDFCNACEQQHRLATIDRAGRSTPSIMEAANALLHWVNHKYAGAGWTPNLLPFREQAIRPVAPNDPQPDANPAPLGKGVELHSPRDIYETAKLIGERAIALLQEQPDYTAAVLVRENRQGRWLAEVLANARQHGFDLDFEAAGITLYEVAEGDRRSHIPREMLDLLRFLDRPHSPDYLKTALRVLVERQLVPPQDLDRLSITPEQFLYPSPLAPGVRPPTELKAARFCQQFLRARLELPPSQWIPFLALALNYSQSELATADKLAERLAHQVDGATADMLAALAEIVGSERFEAVETEDSESVYTRRNQLTIITMHKAKGLDWDCVFLPFLHERVIPGVPWIRPQTQFLGDYDPAEVVRAQIRASLHGEEFPTEAEAWQQATRLKMAEEYRLLYVAMTRAKRLLWMSAAKQAPFVWSQPEKLDALPPCPALAAFRQ